MAATVTGPPTGSFVLDAEGHDGDDADPLAGPGWRLWSDEIVLSVLQLAQDAAGCDAALVVLRDEAGRFRVYTGSSESFEPDEVAALWHFGASEQCDAPCEAAGGDLVARISHAVGETAAVLVLRGGESSESRRLAAERSAELLCELLKESGIHQSRRGAYEALFQIGSELQSQEVDAEKVFQLIIEHARQLLGTDVAWLGLVDEDNARVWIKAATGVTTSEFSRMEVELGTGIGGVAVREGRPVSVGDHRRYDSGMPSSVHRALNSEGVISILCAPLMKNGDPLGALYVGTRAPREFREADASLLSALAAQATVAIKNARLYQALSEQNETLERTFTIHRLLTDASLQGSGMHEVAFELARLIDRDVVVELDGSNVRRYLYRRGPNHRGQRIPVELGEDEVAEGFAAVVLAGRVGFGTVTALGRLPIDPVQQNAVEYGAAILALELVKAQSALEVEWRLQGEMLEEMLKADVPCESLRARAERLGVDLGVPRRVAVLQPGPGTSTTTLLEVVRRTLRHSEDARPGLVTQRGTKLIVAVADGAEDGKAGGFVERLAAAADAAQREVVFSGGISRSSNSLLQALREAEAALALSVSSDVRGTVVHYEDLGPLRFMLDAPDTREMVGLVQEHLGPLASQDANRQSDYLKTLKAFLETGGHQPTTAARCHIHVSTLKYRLGRISEVLDRPLGEPKVRFELSLAFSVLAILEILGVDPFAVEHRAA